jgi:hypothetical protein
MVSSGQYQSEGSAQLDERDGTRNGNGDKFGEPGRGANVSEIIKELRASTKLALVLSAVWLLLAGSYEQAVDRSEMTRDLVAYLLLRDAVAAIPVSEVESRTDALTQICHEIVDARSEVNVCLPLTITAPWDSSLKTGFELDPHPKFLPNKQASDPPIRVYSVMAKGAFLPIGSYLIAVDGRRIVPIHDVSLEAVRFVYDAMRLNDPEHELLRSPRLWNYTNILLSSLGASGPASGLKVTDPVISHLMADYLSVQSVRETVAGLPLPILMLPFGIAALLIIPCCFLAGTWSSLRAAQSNPPSDEFEWLMLHTGTGTAGVVTRIAAVVLAVTVCLVPVAGLAKAVQLAAKISGPVDLAGLLLVSIILGVLLFIMGANLFEQFRLRSAISHKVRITADRVPSIL